MYTFSNILSAQLYLSSYSVIPIACVLAMFHLVTQLPDPWPFSLFRYLNTVFLSGPKIYNCHSFIIRITDDFPGYLQMLKGHTGNFYFRSERYFHWWLLKFGSSWNKSQITAFFPPKIALIFLVQYMSCILGLYTVNIQM